MNKAIILLITIMSLLMLPFISGTDLYGIYENDNVEIESGTFNTNSMVNVRANFYAVVYQGDSSDGFLKIIELDDSNNIINSSVDTWEFDTTYASYPKVLNFDTATGLSVIGYIGDNGNPVARYRSFKIYENGTIQTGSSATGVTGSTNQLQSMDLIKTSSTTFLGSYVNNYPAAESYLEYYGGTISPDGSLTMGSQLRTKCMNKVVAAGYNFEKVGGTCTSFFKQSTGGTGRRYNVACSDTTTTGTFATYSCSSVITPTQWESEEIDNLKVTHDTDGGYYILTYGETLDDYPVIATIDEGTLAVTDKIRISNSTADENAIHYLDSNNVLLAYNIGSVLNFETYSVNSGTGALTQQYTTDMTTTASYMSFADVDTNEYAMSYASSSGDVMTLGIGLVPPPEPEDTQVSIKDERTLAAYDLTDKTLTFYAHCEDNINYQTNISSTTQSIPVDCNYNSFSIKVEYDVLNVTYAYTRYYLRDLTDTYEQFNLDIYLIDPFTTEYVQNEFIVDDLTDKYTNAKLYFEKNINGVTTQITAAQIDLTNSMRAIIINGDTYYVYLENEDGERNFLGTIVAPPSGVGIESTTLRLYDIKLKLDPTKVGEKLGYYIYSDEEQVEYLVQTLEGVDANLINMTLNIYNGTIDTGTLIYNVTKGGAYDANNLSALFSDTGINLSAYENNTVSFDFNIYFYDTEIRQIQYEGYLWENHKIELPILSYLPTGFMNWFILILLSVVAVYASTKTADYTALAIMVLAGVFVMFGWYTVGSGVIALALMVTLINVIRKGGQ